MNEYINIVWVTFLSKNQLGILLCQAIKEVFIINQDRKDISSGDFGETANEAYALLIPYILQS